MLLLLGSACWCRPWPRFSVGNPSTISQTMNKLWILGALLHCSHASYNVSSSLVCGGRININGTLMGNFTATNGDIPQCAMTCNDDDACQGFAGDSHQPYCFLFFNPIANKVKVQQTGLQTYWDMGCFTTTSRTGTSTIIPTSSSITSALSTPRYEEVLLDPCNGDYRVCRPSTWTRPAVTPGPVVV